ncbi:enhancer of polycomb homolog 1-like [Littorina saxatilis]|uniref:enhancer of polycomb homolog 1-like n=2 Tax=Littorina saxatilis TaxID=31220 RepID=UPI0038B62AA5
MSSRGRVSCSAADALQFLIGCECRRLSAGPESTFKVHCRDEMCEPAEPRGKITGVVSRYHPRSAHCIQSHQGSLFSYFVALGMEQEIPDYDLDSEDESWLQEQSKKMEITPIKFEEMMDRLEKGSGQQVVTLPEAKLLLKEDDDLIIAVYDYWLNKRLRLEMPLIQQVKSEKRDGTTTNNPYVAFRRRTEKMQTRKNRKNDEVSYERMLKLKRDMVKASTLTQFLKRREKSKKEIVQLTIEIMEKRFQMEDFSGALLEEAEAEREKMPSFIPPYMFNSNGQAVSAYNGDEVAPVRKKRQYKRRQKQSQQSNHPHATAAAIATAASFGDVDILHHDLDSSEEDIMSPAMSPSDHEDENDPDGAYAFKRRKSCNYFPPLCDRLGNWPWCDPEEGGKGDKRHCFSLTTLPGGRCVGFARRRVGRGGRVILDRGVSPWDDALEKLDLASGQSYSGRLGEYITYIREKKIPYYRPQTPPPEEDTSLRDNGRSLPRSLFNSKSSSSPSSQEFNLELFNCHREQLLEMHREQEARLLNQEVFTVTPSNQLGSPDLQRSFSSQPTSRFTLDSASAQFAVSAVIDSSQLETNGVLKGSEGVNGVGSIGGGGSVPAAGCVNAGGDAGQPASIVVVSDAAVTIPSTSLVSSLSSVTSSVALAPVTFSPQPSIMATKTAGTASAPSAVQSHHTPLSSLTLPLSTASLLSLSAHSVSLATQNPHVTSNGPVAVSSVSAISGVMHGKTPGLAPAGSILHLHLPITTATVPRAVVAAPSVTPSATPTIPAPVPTPIPVCASSAPGPGKINSKQVPAGVGASGMCNLATSSPMNILKTSHEEGNSSVHIFNADTPMPMDVS